MKKLIFILFSICLVATSCQKQDSQSERTEVLEKEVLPHPRLLFSSNEEEVLKKQIPTVPLMSELQDALIKEADKLISAPLQEYKLRDVNYTQDILMISREQVYRMITLSLAYRMTGDKKYLDKAEKELVNVCDFPDWNPQHYLDVAEMTTAVAIAYDWLYDKLSEESRKSAVHSIKTKALDLAIKEYADGGPNSWAKRETNWNVVCNTGMVMGALAIAEHYPELTEQIIQNAVRYIPNCLKHFAPDGVCYEGPAYWGYTNIYLSVLLSALNMNFDNDLGISGLEGISKTALYYVHSTSPSGKIFNFANSGGTSPDTNPMYFFFSKHFNQPEVAAFYRDIVSRKLKENTLPRWFFFMSLPWFDNSSYSEREDQTKLTVYKGINDIAVMNSNKGKSDNIYLIAKGGDPDEAHQQLDIGTFIIETNGIRWSDDLGADDYSLPGFWDYKPEGQRWHYFRNTNFSHNTLAIDNHIQNSAGTGKIIAYEADADQPFFKIDMTSGYEGQARSVIRTFTLTDGNSVTITDNIQLNKASQQVSWNMITSAAIECRGKEAVLSKDGKSFHLTIISPLNAVFSSQPAKTFTDKEKPLNGYELLQVNISGEDNPEIKIRMRPALDNM